VIEEDGKTEEEFIQEVLNLNTKFQKLNIAAQQLEQVVITNIKQLVGEM
jgi:type I restriction enzyme M protein